MSAGKEDYKKTVAYKLFDVCRICATQQSSLNPDYKKEK